MKVIQSSVVRALVAIVVGVMLILYRKATLEWMVIITGALFFLSGCLSCLAYYWGRRKAIRPPRSSTRRAASSVPTPRRCL